MPKPDIDHEMTAIKAIIQALKPLTPEAQQRVLDYAIGHLELAPRPATAQQPPPAPPAHEAPGAQTQIKDIRSLREQKNPTTDTQMAAIVAYYLAEIAPAELRKDTIGTQDMKKYFKQAGHPLPPAPYATLNNTKMAGYLDKVDRNAYKLNPVGYNLVVHNLPQSGQPAARPKAKGKRSRKRAAEHKPAKTRAARPGKGG